MHSVMRQPEPVLRLEEVTGNDGSRDWNTSNCTSTSVSAASASAMQTDHRRHGEEPADVRIDEVEEPLGIDALEPHREDVGERRHPLLALALVAALDELLALAGGVGDHQAAAVQHADELLQLFGADRLRREVALEPLGDFVEARLAVEHLQDRVLLFLEAVVLQADGILHDPIEPPLVAMLPRAQIGPLANRQLSRRAGDKAFGKGGH